MTTSTAPKLVFAIAILASLLAMGLGAVAPTYVSAALIGTAALVFAWLSFEYWTAKAADKTTNDWFINADWIEDAFCVSDISGKIKGMNSACRAMVGDGAETVTELMEPLHELLVERQQADDVVSAILSAPEIKFSDTLTLNDGRIIERATRPIVGTDDRLWHLIDVTQVVLAESDSAMHREMVEDDAARTAELAEQLYHAKAELESKQSELTWLANTDPMTGLLNRRRFLTQAEEAIASASEQEHLWVFMMDMDYFKRINDTYGHAAGDMALRDFSNVATDAVGEAGFIGRMGGEEFAVILNDCSRDEAYRIAERIRRSTTNSQTVCEAEKFRFTTSIGVASWNPGEISIEPALDRADKALYTAKTYGRNRVVGYE